MTESRQPVVLSLEQALSMPYGTQRFVQLGWRVIRIEPTPTPGRKTKGDPNRYIGHPVAGKDLCSYFVSPNVGKEAIALNLKQPDGQRVLHRLIDALGVDVFCTNTMPSRHESLGIDYPTLSAVHPALIWCGISAMGAAYPNVPGYDPATQALCGFMDLTGEKDGDPMQCGPPLIDLKAGDEVFAQVLLAMLERSQTGAGKKIDISLAHAAVSWLHTFLPMLDMGSTPSQIRRNGNKHRQFIPVNSYPTTDGHIYVALGSDVQWTRFVEQEMFASLDQERFHTNESRRREQDDLHRLIGEITAQHPLAEVAAILRAAAIPHSPITPIEKVADLEFVKNTALRTTRPDGGIVRLPPPAVPIAHLDTLNRELPFPPAYGEHTDAVLTEAGCDPDEIAHLRSEGAVA